MPTMYDFCANPGSLPRYLPKSSMLTKHDDKAYLQSQRVNEVDAAC